MKVLITGSNGLVGSALVRVAREKFGFSVVACSQSYNKVTLSEQDRFELCDITDHTKTAYIIEKHCPDAVIHTAALSKPDYCEQNKSECWKINVLATEAIANICNAVQIPLVNVSSDFIFDGLLGNYSELDTPNPGCYYGVSKAESENIVMNYPLNSSVRTSLVYGWPVDESKGNILTWVTSNLRNNNKIKVVCDQHRSPTLVDDLALGCLEIIARKCSGIYNISGNETISVCNFAKQIARCFKLDESLISPIDTLSLSEPAKRPLKTGLNISKAIVDLNFNPHSINEGLKSLL